MNSDIARTIILHAVKTTQPRWSEYDTFWRNIDRNFIQGGYEQGGFQMFRMVPLFAENNIYSIESLGSILNDYTGPRKYDRNYAGSLNSEFYNELHSENFGNTGAALYECVNSFLTKKLGNPGAFFWRMIWQLLISCNYLRENYNSSFSEYLKTKYAKFISKECVSDSEILAMSSEEWDEFLQKVKPWQNLYGIGENVFNFIVGDIVEAKFVPNSFKFDSSNERFLKVTGIAELINPLDRETTIKFLKGLNLTYTLREINKGIYTYCSVTEKENSGFCRSKHKCLDCEVSKLCKQLL
jgi:hypothetical protein